MTDNNEMTAILQRIHEQDFADLRISADELNYVFPENEAHSYAAGTSLAFWLAGQDPHFEALQQITPETLNHIVASGPYKGASVALWLAPQPQDEEVSALEVDDYKLGKVLKLETLKSKHKTEDQAEISLAQILLVTKRGRKVLASNNNTFNIFHFILSTIESCGTNQHVLSACDDLLSILPVKQIGLDRLIQNVDFLINHVTPEFSFGILKIIDVLTDELVSNRKNQKELILPMLRQLREKDPKLNIRSILQNLKLSPAESQEFGVDLNISPAKKQRF